MISIILSAALAATQVPVSARVHCIGVVVPISGLRAADLDDEAVADLRRFARAHRGDDYRTNYVVFAPYGYDRGTTSNQAATQLRGDTVRTHLVAAGLPESRIRVLRLGEHADYGFPTELAEIERAIERRPGLSGRWTNAASVTIELPPHAPSRCAS
ncbi:MAG TPA: hypothetical protein VMG08_11090 [Allosphingosinicella sp.]|nr:hypothetical protein [Allosphingosinicella sp.]